MKQFYDVIIVGGGVTAAATSYFLHDNKKLSVGLVKGGSSLITASHGIPGYVSGGAWDNFTRLTHAHNAHVGAALWQFGCFGRDLVREICDRNSLNYHQGKRLRILNGPREIEEAKKAVIELQAAGFQSSIGPAPWDQSLQVQDDGPAYLVSPEELLKASFGKHHLHEATVSNIRSDGMGVIVEFENGEEWKSEIAVLATHLETGNLVQGLKDVFISFADQVERVQVTGDADLALPTGTLITMNHSYEWGIKVTHGEWWIGGGRYLRPLAGIEAKAPYFDDSIAAKTSAKFSKSIGFSQYSRLQGTGHSALGCRPCDELPVIGPMFGEGRILLAAGYMQNGIAFGYAAGKCLADLILHGKAQDLPRAFWPERQRSLGDQL